MSDDLAGNVCSALVHGNQVGDHLKALFASAPEQALAVFLLHEHLKEHTGAGSKWRGPRVPRVPLPVYDQCRVQCTMAAVRMMTECSKCFPFGSCVVSLRCVSGITHVVSGTNGLKCSVGETT